MFAKFVLYNSKHTPGRDLLSTFSAIVHCEGCLRYSVRRPTSRRPCYSTLLRLSAVLGSKTDISTALLLSSTLWFCLKSYCTFSTLSAAAILYCEGSLRYSVRRPTSRRPGCLSTLRTLSTALCETTSDLLLLPYYIWNALYDLLLLVLLLYIYSHLLVST